MFFVYSLIFKYIQYLQNIFIKYLHYAINIHNTLRGNSFSVRNGKWFTKANKLFENFVLRVKFKKKQFN